MTGLRGLVGDLVLDGEQVFVVDRDGAGEDEAFAIVPGQRDGRVDAKCSALRAGALLGPDRFGGRHFGLGGGVADPAELGIKRLRRAGRRQQDDRRRAGVDRFAEFQEPQVVDAAAFERDRAGQARRLDIDVRAVERLVAGHGLPGGARRFLLDAGRRAGCTLGGRRRRPRTAARADRIPVSARPSPAVAAAEPVSLCFNCGIPTKYCHAIKTIADSTMARMVFF